MSLNDEAVKLYGDAARNWNAFHSYLVLRPLRVFWIMVGVSLLAWKVGAMLHWPSWPF